MSTVALRLGPLAAPGYRVLHSGIRWLFEDGHVCRPGEPIAFCNIALTRNPGSPTLTGHIDEFRDFQVAFAPRRRGRLRHSGPNSVIGYLCPWTPDFVIGHLDCAADEFAPGREEDTELGLLMLAGRRLTELAEQRSGLLTGWHDRTRAWWGEGESDPGTLLSMGNCEQTGIIRGERQAYLEMFELAPGPAQVVYLTHEPLVPCAAVAIQQLRRTPAEAEEIAADLANTLPAGPVVPTPADWMFAGALLAALRRSPLTDTYTVLTRRGFGQPRPADAVLLTISSEEGVLLRHRQLGYAMKCHAYRIADAGPAVQAWVRSKFEPIKRSIADIRRDYDELIDLIRARSPMQILLQNLISSAGHERIYNYAPFDAPMASTLTEIYAKEVNLMLHDIARERDVAIVDVDAIAAKLGAGLHIPDGLHQSDPMQAEVRREIVRILADRGVRGFGAARIS